MKTLIMISAIFGSIGGASYACAWAFKRLGERQFLKYLAYLCYETIALGDEIYWEDLEQLYTRETKRLVGTSGRLTEPEGYILVNYISNLCQENPPRHARWEILLRNLKRSFPQNWVVTLGTNTYSNVMALLLLVWNISTLKAIGNAVPTTGNWWITAGGSILSVLIFFVAAFQIWFFVKGYRATYVTKHSFRKEDDNDR